MPLAAVSHSETTDLTLLLADVLRMSRFARRRQNGRLTRLRGRAGGPRIVDLARGIAHDGVLTPSILGLARSASFDPQELKKVWHYIARYGTRA